MEEKTIVSRQDGLRLSVLFSEPQSGQEIRGVVQISHGMCEYKERYTEFMEYLSEHGYAAVIHDHRGHGKSIKSTDDFGYFYEGKAAAAVKDLHQITKEIKIKYPNKPLYLFGHSMGSLIARVYVKHYSDELDGVMICGSPGNNRAAFLGKKIAAGLALKKGDHYRSELLRSLVSGGFNRKFTDNRSVNNWICSDHSIVNQYDEDERCGFTFTLNGYSSLFSLVEAAYSKQGWRMKNPELPIWFLSGQDDPCMGSRNKFLEAVSVLQYAGYENVTYRLYPGMRHEILNEISRRTVFDDVLKKLNSWNYKTE